MSSTGGSRRGVSSGKGAPPPRRTRRTPPGADDAPADAAAVVASPPRRATVVAPDRSPSARPGAPGSDGPDRAAPSAGSRRPRAPWWLRIVAWLVAVPVGLVLVGVPARKLGYLDSQKLLDVVIGDDLGRYFPLVVIVLLWALVTAVLVQVVVEGGAWLLRRRARSADTGRSAA